MRTLFESFELDDDRQRMNLPLVHSWLSRTYWGEGMTIDRLIRAATASSMLVGGYAEGIQISYARIVSDKTFFALLTDVYVVEQYRGRGLARAMTRFALSHPEFQGLRRWILGTKDAHGVYAAVGFEPLREPSRWMEFRPTQGNS